MRSHLRILAIAAASALLIGQAQAFQYRQSKTVDDKLARTLFQYAEDAPLQLHKIIGNIPIYVMDDVALFKSPAVAKELNMARAFQQSVSDKMAGWAMWPMTKGGVVRSISLFADKFRSLTPEQQREIVIHELMHHLDYALGNVSQSQGFMVAYKKDAENFNKVTRTMASEDRESFNNWIGYYIKSSHEAFADVAAHLVYPQSDERERAIYFDIFAETSAVVTQVLRSIDIPIDADTKTRPPVFAMSTAPANAAARNCAVVRNTPDGFLNLRRAPTTKALALTKLKPGWHLSVDASICASTEDWTHVTAVWPLDGGPDGPTHTPGWVATDYIKFIECPD